ncbi:hypothetical protein M3M39_05445 [Fructilactobacillus hinvesii]|uniref:dUTPase n=1 Tax=Fructilactobacillus hinvesii TaxID=2940300 RepID=A0ABY5BSK3_9LACO|nr:hypothetical protein [Fructilactobacillus hinvesii]USS87566.1 hypothetical protein M3M39_05445 [Fructilactobacillus hinvesii]
MTFKQMQTDVLSYYQQLDVQKHLIWTQPRHQTAALVSLDLQLARLAGATGLETGVVAQPDLQPQSQQLQQFVHCLRSFFLFANLMNWNQVCQPTATDLDRLQQLDIDDQAQKATLYLMMKRMLLTSYYEKRSDAFQHAWMLFLKWGMVDYGWKLDQIEQAFATQLHELEAELHH